MTKYIPVISGGLDSTTLAYRLHDSGVLGDAAVSFNYGQRHKKELEFAKVTCDTLGLEHIVIDLWSSGFTDAIAESGSSLVSDTDVPEGHYAEENMKQTVVPNRNMVMLAIAGSVSVARGADGIATGVHAGDHFIYPDCRPEFIRVLEKALMYGNEGFGKCWVIAPFLYLTKADIAAEAMRLNVPLDQTWSCYKGGDIHCGKCGTCVERLEAIDQASAGTDFEDPTQYEDTEYWRQVVEAAK